MNENSKNLHSPQPECENNEKIVERFMHRSGGRKAEERKRINNLDLWKTQNFRGLDVKNYDDSTRMCSRGSIKWETNKSLGRKLRKIEKQFVVIVWGI
jgi:hypothetical protein